MPEVWCPAIPQGHLLPDASAALQEPATKESRAKLQEVDAQNWHQAVPTVSYGYHEGGLEQAGITTLRVSQDGVSTL